MTFGLKRPGFLPAESIAEYMILLVLAFTAGAAASCAMAPYHWWGLLFPAFSGLYLLLQCRPSFRAGFGFGWAFGFGYFLFGLSWIGNALLVEGNPYAWAWPLAVSALPAGLAFFPAIACGLACRFTTLKRLGGFLAFCALLSLSEWLRGHLFTGFPWNLTAYAWGNDITLMQGLGLTGIYTLSLFVIMLAAVPGFVALRPRCYSSWLLAILLGGLLAGLAAYGSWRLENAPVAVRENIILKIVQPNIPQEEKWDGRKIAEHFERHVVMSAAQGDEDPNQTTIIIWPETALHYLFYNDAGARGAIRAMLEAYPGPAYLVAGVLIRDMPADTFGNSIVSIDKTGQTLTRFDKFHLVPFGEYIPFQRWIPLETVTRFSGFKPGPGPVTQSLPLPDGTDLTFSPLVCYEILFPAEVIDLQNPPDIIVNATNDGWYGFSAGPHQHLLKARFRAIEEGIPVARAANTGISALIDPYGRVMLQSDLFTDAVFTAPLPQSLDINRKYVYIKCALLYWILVAMFILSGYKREKSPTSSCNFAIEFLYLRLVAYMSNRR